MAKLPKKQTTISRIFESYEASQGGHRAHLGASEIGEECERALWYKFRHAFINKFEGRMLRLFLRGHNEEITFNNELRAIGVEVVSHDENGKQISFRQHDNPHFSGSMDAALLGLVEAPKTWHVADYKTAALKKFLEFVKANDLMVSSPKYFAQLMMYMGWSGMKRAIIFIANKNTDDLHSERIEYSKKGFDYYVKKAQRVVFASRPLTKINEKVDWWQCKWCDSYDICKMDKVPEVGCRTCCHSTPTTEIFIDTIDGEKKECGEWRCDKHGYQLTGKDQAIGCGDHIFIPELIPAEMIKGDTAASWIMYEKEDGTVFVNSGVSAPEQVFDLDTGEVFPKYSSEELNANFLMVGDKGVEVLKKELNATIAKTSGATYDKINFDDDIPF